MLKKVTVSTEQQCVMLAGHSFEDMFCSERYELKREHYFTLSDICLCYSHEDVSTGVNV